MNPSMKKWIARVLAISMINPALYVPSAMAADTDVYSGFLGAESTTIQPNVLLLVDTSDSMNLPEAWREYANESGAPFGGYDSHVEYLWNDLNIIVDADADSAGEISATNDSDHISVAAVPASFSTKLGFWQGNSLAERQALWQAARTSAKATATGDPGPGSQYRNYNDLSWIYWLPAGTATTDSRLFSPSWNKFRGYIKEFGNGVGGSDLRGGPTFTDSDDYRLYNQCGASLADLTPSTVFVPSETVRNSGIYANQQWARWEPYLNLAAVGVSTYPGSSVANESLAGQVHPKGYVDSSSPSTGNPASNTVSRDSYPKNTSATTGVGAKGLPIRYDDGTARSGWDGIKADAGGFVLRSIIDAYTSRADLDIVKGWYLTGATSDVDSSLSTNLNDAKFIAWKGNRGSILPSPVFGMETGVPAYYDVSSLPCDSATGPSKTTCLDKPSGSDVGAFTLTKTATCKLAGTSFETDVNNTKIYRDGSCVIDTVSNSGTDGNGATYPNFSDVPAPTVCPSPNLSNTSFKETDYSNCGTTTTTVVPAIPATTPTCSRPNTTLTVGGYSLTGATNVNVNTCGWTGQTSDTVASCGWAGRQTKVVGSCAWSGRVATLIEGVGYKATGGTCQENGASTYCAGATDNTIYPSAAAAIAATASCTNTTAAGSYTYGGTCTENGAATHCAISGGSGVLGGAYANVNATCGNANNPAIGTYKYGGTCSENGSGSASTLACQAGGGTSLTIRGNTQTYNQSCSNKANSGTTKNQVGTYPQGGTCTAGANNTVTSTPSATSFIVRGTTYNSSPTCTNGTTPGTYNRATAACSGTNVPCAEVSLYRGTSVVNGGFTWYQTAGTCTTPTPIGGSTAQTYVGTCEGRYRDMPDFPPGEASPFSRPGWVNNQESACNSTTNTVTLTIPAGTAPNPGGVAPISCSSGTTTAAFASSRTCVYTNINKCTTKGDVNTTCSERYGINCSTGCDDATPTSLTFAGASAGHNFFRTYNFVSGKDYLVHDCKADDGAGATPKYMHYSGSTLNSFGNQWSAGSSYASSATGGVADSADTKVDMYSVNYLNWKYGPKGPNGHPIGRKTRLQIAKDVMTNVIGSISGVRIGIMSFNQIEKLDPMPSSGAHLTSAIKDLDATSRPALIASVNAMVASSATPLTESLYEAYRYFKGEAPMFGGGNATGTNYATVEALGSVTGNLRYATQGRDESAAAIVSGQYVSPITQTCQANMVILISDGAPEGDTDTPANDEILALPDVGSVSIVQGTTSGQFETTGGLPYGPADSASTLSSPDNFVLLDELANYMAKVDANATLAGDQFVKLSTVQFGVSAPVLNKAAEVGGGNSYSANSASGLQDALIAAIRSVTQMQPQGSMPASAFNRSSGQTDDVYVAAFSPSYSIAWPGTIKKYLLSSGATACGAAGSGCGAPNTCLTGNASVTYGSCGINVEKVVDDPTLGINLRVIRSEAVSLWIPSSSPDGGYGNKGGTGQMLISTGAPNTRALYTYLGSEAVLSDSANAIVDGNALITKTLLGDATMSAATRSELIAYAQGSDGLATTTWRTWPHYDSVHSAPVVDEKTGQTVYYLTSDGVLHAVNTSTGLERWAFMVPEGLPKISNFKANAIGDHLEVADGDLIQVTTAEATPRNLLVFGLRRGGKAYYALDVTDQDAPKFAWKITSATTGYGNLGDAWSTPQTALIRGLKNAESKLKPVLIFGGGYDTSQDASSAGTDSIGNSVFVADAADGALIREFTTTASYSIPSDVLAIDTNGDSEGTVDRVYVGDMGGNLWRMDLDDMSAANQSTSWSIVRLAKLFSTTRPKNKLFNKPIVAPVSFEGQVFDAVYVGGGDMQHPLDKTTGDSGAFFMVKDFTVNGVAAQAASVPNANSSAAPSTTLTTPFSQDFVDMSSVVGSYLYKHSGDTDEEKLVKEAAIASLKTAKGFVLNLTEGRKVSSYATVVNGEAYFGIYFPRQDSAGEGATQCIIGGYGEQWGLDALTGTAIRDSAGNTVFAGVQVAGYSGIRGVPLSIISKNGKVFLRGGNFEVNSTADKPCTDCQSPDRAVEYTPKKIFWYSVPEQQ